MKLTIEVTARMATAVLSRLLTAEVKHSLDLDRPKHYSDVSDFMALLSVALEKDASRAPEVSKAPGSMDGERKRGRGRPAASEAPKSAKTVAAKDCKHPTYVLRRCTNCGEPEPQTCERDYHLYEDGKCVRCERLADAASNSSTVKTAAVTP